MADVHKGHDSTGIKLFGKTITVQGIRELKEEPADKSEDDHQKKPEKIIPCPRCKSMETKFCYFNNYNVNQPRHFCKGCQRYWTAGGALRNVPVGAGRRKVKPMCQGLVEIFSDGPFLDHRQLGFDGVVKGWHAAAQDDFRHFFPAKRRRNLTSAGD